MNYLKEFAEETSFQMVEDTDTYYGKFNDYLFIITPNDSSQGYIAYLHVHSLEEINDLSFYLDSLKGRYDIFKAWRYH